MRSVLITGFEAFGEHDGNPSQKIVEQLDGAIIGDAQVHGLILPVVFGKDTKPAFEAIDRINPALVVLFGLDAGADSIHVEIFAVNHRNSDDGKSLTPIIENGPAAYFATIDIDAICAAISKRANVPARKHGYAGSYLCNHIFYQTSHFAASKQLSCKVGFIHVPLSTDQIGAKNAHKRSLPLEKMIHAARIAIEEGLR